MNKVNIHDNDGWEEKQKRVEDYIRRFSDPKEREKMVFCVPGWVKSQIDGPDRVKF